MKKILGSKLGVSVPKERASKEMVKSKVSKFFLYIEHKFYIYVIRGKVELFAP